MLAVRKYFVIPLLVVFYACQPGQNEAEESPLFTHRNVVFIVSDDHSTKAIGVYGNEMVRTPHLDHLAGQGVRFTNAYSNAPICSATRQSLLTGKYPHATGVNLLFTPFPDDGNITIAEHLRQHGFKTALFGKSHFNNWVWHSLYNNGVPDHGFDILDESSSYKKFVRAGGKRPVPDSIITYSREKFGMEPAYRWNAYNHPANCFDEDCKGTFLARQAVDFMKQNQKNRFCLWLAFHEPHSPFAFPVEYQGKYNPDDIVLPEGSPEDDRWIPKVFAGLTDDEKRGIIASYYASVEYMDKNVGIVLNALDDLGLDENTLVVYLGDQGYLLYDHKRFEKHTMWKESIKAPLIIRGKGINQNKVSDALVEFVDVVPTVLEALNVEPLKTVQGNSFLPVLTGNDSIHREYVYAEFLEDNKAMVATKEWKYIFTTGKRDLGLGYATGNPPSGIYHRLYNLYDDPGETTNLAYEPEYVQLISNMQDKMIEWFMKTHPDAKNIPGELNRTGRLVWFCEPRDIGAEYGETPLRVFEQGNQ